MTPDGASSKAASSRLPTCTRRAERKRVSSIWRSARRSDRPTHWGGNFAARRYLHACHHRFVNGYESTDQVRGIVPVPPMEMKGSGTVLEQPTAPSASEEQPCPVSTSIQFAGRSRWSRSWSCSASGPRNDRGAVVGKLSVARLLVGPPPLVLGEGGGGLLRSP
jgi:hypothetical protein